MKKLIIILIGIFSFISCDDFLEEDISTLVTSDSGALNNVEGLTAALVGTYKPLGQSWVKGFGMASTQALLMGGDDLTTHKAANKADLREFDQYKISQMNGRLPNIWSGCYKSIQGSNNIIANYENATGDQAEINQVAGEAFYLRAYNYFWIVRLWGKAPLVLETQVFDEEILSIESSNEQQIYDQILKDVKDAQSLLGDLKPQPGRANKGAALALEAEVNLQMAGWPLKQTDKYGEAARIAGDLIAEEDKYGFGLMDNFIDLWPSKTINNDGNKEEVFALNFFGKYNANVCYFKPARPSDEGFWDDYFSELTFFNEFPDQVRKDVTFMTELSDGTPWQNFNTGRPYFQKLQSDKSYKYAVSMPLERMAEVYFVYAEAQVMSTGDNADAGALEAVNKIVRRAYGLPINTPDPSVDYTSITQKQIVQEKAWEFAAEYCRWFDLIRLEMVEEVVAKKDPDDLQPLGAIKYYIPLPASETLANPNLKEGS